MDGELLENVEELWEVMKCDDYNDGKVMGR